MIPLFCSRILHACPVIESHDVDLIPARTHDAVIRDLPEKKSSSPPPLWSQVSTSPSAMKRSIRAVTTGSGTEPSSSTASWKARMLNFAPSVFSAVAENSLSQCDASSPCWSWASFSSAWATSDLCALPSLRSCRWRRRLSSAASSCAL